MWYIINVEDDVVVYKIPVQTLTVETDVDQYGSHITGKRMIATTDPWRASLANFANIIIKDDDDA